MSAKRNLMTAGTNLLVVMLIFFVGNVVARGTERGPDALAVSSDSKRLAFVGPTEYIVTIMDARSLDEVQKWVLQMNRF